MPWSEQDDIFFGSNTPAAVAKPRSYWQRFKDEYLGGAVHSPIGAEGVVRATTDLSAEELNRRERIISDRVTKAAEDDPAWRPGSSVTSGQEAALKKMVDLAGSALGSVDPTWVLGAGKSIVTKALSQAGINAAVDAGGQLVEVKRGVRDEYDPVQTGWNAIFGAATQGAIDVHSKVSTGRRVAAGSKMPGWKAVNDIIVNDLEGGGTLAKPKTSPKGAMGPQQVMPETARKPGFGIRPWDGKTQADLARVGRQYSAAMMHKYNGDPAKVLAAYNAGPGKVDALLKRYGDDWRRHLPEETIKYVKKGLGKLGRPGKPILEDFDFTPPEERGDIRLVRDELPSVDEMKRVNDALSPEEVDILRQADDSSYSDREAAKAAKDAADWEEWAALNRDMEDGDGPSLMDAQDRDIDARTIVNLDDVRAKKQLEDAKELNTLLDDIWEDWDSAGILTPAERQDWDASVSPPIHAPKWNPNYPKGLGKGSIGVETANDLRGPARSMTDPIEPPVKIKTDNPGGEWLRHQRERAESYSGSHPVTGAVTGYLRDGKVMVDPEAIKNIPGSRGEVRGPGEHQYDNLLADVNKNGYKDDGAILIGVNHKGEPYIIEGNTRAAVARAKGIKAIPAEIRYFAGGEQVDGPLHPSKLDSILAKEPKYPGKQGVPPEAPRMPPRPGEDTDGYSTRGPKGGKDRVITDKDEFLALRPKLVPATLEQTLGGTLNMGRDVYWFQHPNGKKLGPFVEKLPSKGLLKDIISDNKGVYRPEGPDTAADVPLTAVEKLTEALRLARPLAAKQRKLYAAARSERLGKVAGVADNTHGEQGFFQELSQLRGDMPKVDFDNIRQNFTQEDIDELFDMAKRHPGFSLYDKINARKGLLKILGQEGGSVPTRNEIKLLSEIFPKDTITALMKNREFRKKFGDAIGNALNIPRSLMSSFDLSAPFRQGVFMIGRKEFWKNFGPMFKAFASKNAFEEVRADIRSRPTYKLMTDANLALSDVKSGNLSDREEQFMSSWAEKIPGIGKGVEMSSRAYETFLNKLRADVFDDLLAKGTQVGKEWGHEPEALKDLGRFINAATGRGSLSAILGEHGDAAAPFLSGLFFSPRLMASRVQMLNPAFYATLDPFVRKEAIKSLVVFGGIATTVLGLAKMNGLEVETDMRSSDFGKIKVGNTRFDILGGFQQYLRLAAQIVTGESKTLKGETLELNNKHKGGTRYTKFLDFLRSKASPVAAYVVDAMDGENIIGEKFDAKRDAIESFIPLFIQDLGDAIKEHGTIGGIATAVPAVFGVGVSTFKPRPSKKEKKDEFSTAPSDEFGDVNFEEWDF